MKKAVLALAALFATAWAAPAMAAEFSYGGFMRYRYTGGNPGTANLALSGAAFDADAGIPGFFGVTDKSGNIWEYRIRQFFNLKVNDHVTTNVKLEWNSFFGDQNGPLGGSNGDLQVGGTANETELRIKNAFLRFDVPNAPVTLTFGQQDFSTPKAIISVEDSTGIKAAVKALGGEHTLFWARVRSEGNPQVAQDSADWFGIVPSFKVNDITVSPHLSYVDIGSAVGGTSGLQNTEVWFFGVDTSGKLGALGFTADLIFQKGEQTDPVFGDTDLFAYIFDASVSLSAGPGTLTVKALYSPGDDLTDEDVDSWQNILATDLGWSPFFHDGSSNSFFAGNVTPGAVLIADVDGDGVDDLGGVHAGGIMAIGVEYAFSPMANLTLTPNAYYLLADEDNPFNNEDEYGIELGIQANWKLWDSVNFLGQFDYLLAGDYFKTTGGQTEDAWRFIIGPNISW